MGLAITSWATSPYLIFFPQQLSLKVALMWRIGGVLFWYMFVQTKSEGKLEMQYWQYDLVDFFHTGILPTSYARETTRCITGTVEFLHDGVGNHLNSALLHLALYASSNSYHQRWLWCEEWVVYYFDICSSKPRVKANWKFNSEEIWQYDLVSFLHAGTLFTSYVGETAQRTTCTRETTRCTTSTVEFLHDGLGNHLNSALLHLASYSSSNSYHHAVSTIQFSWLSPSEKCELSHHYV